VIGNGVAGDLLNRHLNSAPPFLPNNDSCLDYNHRYPLSCDPSSTCQFLVRWRKVPAVGVAGRGSVVSDDVKLRHRNSPMKCRRVEFQVKAFLTSDLSSTEDSIWLALGLSLDREMVRRTKSVIGLERLSRTVH